MAIAENSFCAGNETLVMAIVEGGVEGKDTVTASHRIDIKSVALEHFDPHQAAGTALVMRPNTWKAPDAFGTAVILRPYHLLLDGPNTAKADLKEKTAKPFEARDP